MWALYIQFVTADRKFIASICSMFMGLPAIFGFINIYDNHILAIPYVVGLGVGTYLGLTFNNFFNIIKASEKEQ